MPDQKERVIIIGAGIIGLCCAYYLRRLGYKVSVIDKESPSVGVSYINSGLITPSHFVPFASPDTLSFAMRSFFETTSPLYIQPRFNRDFISWSLKFMQSATQKKVEKSSKILSDLNLLSKKLYKEICHELNFGQGLSLNGLLMAYKSVASQKHERKVAQMARGLGLDVEELSRDQVTELQDCSMDIKGAFLYRDDASCSPERFMSLMMKHLKKLGVDFHFQTSVQSLSVRGSKIEHCATSAQKFEGTYFVLATGSWTSRLLNKIGIRLLLQPGKGYSFDLNVKVGRIPVILTEARVAITPLGTNVRFGGTMEVSGFEDRVKSKRVRAIWESIKEYYPSIDFGAFENLNPKMGLRPLSPDGVPYIGKSYRFNNLIIATGHAMMGWSLGPVTGRLVSEIVADQKTILDISRCNPNRFN